MNTGRPEIAKMTSPSSNSIFGRGTVAINPTLPLTAEGAIEIGCGNPKRAVPRVTTSELSTRDSTGTRIGDGSGGAVRAAISAGDCILEPANQAPIAVPQTTLRTAHKTFTRFVAIRAQPHHCQERGVFAARSQERRVGKECRSRWS